MYKKNKPALLVYILAWLGLAVGVILSFYFAVETGGFWRGVQGFGIYLFSGLAITLVVAYLLFFLARKILHRQPN